MRIQNEAVVLALAVVLAGIGVAPAVAEGSQSDSFSYNPQRQAQEHVRAEIEASVYGCVRSIAFGDINGGSRRRSAIRQDPRLINCFNLLLHSNWFRENEKLPLFNRMVERAIDEVIAGSGP